jgi:hypothetical protein
MSNYVVLSSENITELGLIYFEEFFSKLNFASFYFGENMKGRSCFVAKVSDDIESSLGLEDVLCTLVHSLDFDLQVREMTEKGYLPKVSH